MDKLNISAGTLKAMEQLGDIIIETDTGYRNPVKKIEQKAYDIILNEQQRQVSENIKKIYGFQKGTVSPIFI